MPIQNLYSQHMLWRLIGRGMILWACSLKSGLSITADIQFSTQVVRGTCEFGSDNDLSQTLDFTSFFVANEVEKAAINSPLAHLSWQYSIVCEGYQPGAERYVTVRVKSGNNTQHQNRVFYGAQDKTATGFMITACQGGTQNCQQMDDQSAFKFSTTQNENITLDYRVDFVKRHSQVTPGNATASILIEYQQD